MKRSAEETAMRAAILQWGRARWPTARRVEELVIGDCRIDMAFITEDHIAGVEIKSSQDTLDRFDKQVEVFAKHLPEFWLAYHPKWSEKVRGKSMWWYVQNPMEVDVFAPAPHPVIRQIYSSRAKIDRAITVQTLEILWAGELRRIARRKRLSDAKRGNMRHFIGLLARRLTGDELLQQVCLELRARDAQWVADPPITIGPQQLKLVV